MSTELAMGDHNEKRKRMSCALQIDHPCNLVESLHQACGEGYHFIVTDIIHPHHARDLNSKDAPKIIGRTDRVLTSYDWSKLIVGKLSKAFQVDSEIEHVRDQDTMLLKQELGFASHLVLPAIIIRLTQRDNRNLAHLLYNKLISGACYQIWVQLPMTSASKCSPFTQDQESEDMWEWWNNLRRYANYHRKFGLALELPKFDYIPTDLEIDRWCGEPIRVLIIPTILFIPNQHNQPVLPRVYQEIIKKCMHLDVQYIIKGPKYNHSYHQYCNYMMYLGKKLYDNTVMDEFSSGCEDFLQNPLQPLSEHLEAAVYEIFEKDSVKYVEYQNAIQKALEDMPESKEIVVIMVVGAGRGPLVQAALNASYLTQRKVKVYAVEKNPYAVNTLEERIQNEWKGLVTLIHQDMRVCNPPENADILVSELLGSFGDNELSPECLDGAQRFLNPDGISIPQSYTSFLAPLQSTKLYNEITTNRPADKTLQSLFETPYVVHLVNAYQIAPTQALFTYKHPNWSEKINNERMRTLRFKTQQNCVLTGFAGFFETVLYKDVMLSTNPQTHSPNMVSWFPILFPLAEPIQILEGNIIEITFWRAENEEKVWYEWCINSPFKGTINNVNGRSYFIKKF